MTTRYILALALVAGALAVGGCSGSDAREAPPIVTDGTGDGTTGTTDSDTGDTGDRGTDGTTDSSGDTDATTGPPPVCGDGVIGRGQECDDGNTESGDGCSSDCRIEDGWECSGEPSVCAEIPPPSTCGDGVVEGDEECDDGDDNSDTEPDACRTDCRLAHCGDGVINTGEECDDGSENSNSLPNRCRRDCTLPRCGDGVRDAGEQCDEGEDNGEEGGFCDDECNVIVENACPDANPLVLVEDGERQGSTGFSYRIDFSFETADSTLPIPRPCDENPDLTRTRVVYFEAPVSAEYIIRADQDADAPLIQHWLIRSCGTVAIACELDVFDDEDELADGPPVIRTVLRAGEAVFAVFATTAAGPNSASASIFRGGLVFEDD